MTIRRRPRERRRLLGERRGRETRTQQPGDEQATIGRINGVSAAAVNVTPAIRHRGRRSEEPPRPGTAAPPRHRADYRRFGRRIKEEDCTGCEPDAGWAHLRRVGPCEHGSVARNEVRNAGVLLEGARREERRRPPWARRGHLGRQAQVAQDALDHRGLVDQRNQSETPTAPRTRQGIDAETATHEVSPAWRRRARRSPTAFRRRGRCAGLGEARGLLGRWRVGGVGLARVGGVPEADDERPPRRSRPHPSTMLGVP